MLSINELFDGLYICDKWDWSRKYPVIKISFGSGVATSTRKLTEMICFHLRESETNNNVEAYDKSNYGTYFNWVQFVILKSDFEKATKYQYITFWQKWSLWHFPSPTYKFRPVPFSGMSISCFKFHIQTYSFDNSLSVDRFCNLQLESWLSSFNRLAFIRCSNMALTCL